MKSFFAKPKELLKDKKAVFGLTSVQQFFSIILGLALLAYVIVVIMGTLSGSTVIPAASLSGLINNETGFLNSSGDFLNVFANGTLGASNPVLLTVYNTSTAAVLLPAANYSLNTVTGLVTNGTAVTYTNVNFTYTFNYNSQAFNQANNILTNTSTGITGFFSSINPVYAILAILVIILVLVVLVRTVTGSTATGGQASRPQL